MISNLFLIRSAKEYKVANKIIVTKKINDFVMLSWSEKEPYLTNTHSHFKNVMKWEDFQVEDISLNRYWLNNYKQIESIVCKNRRLYRDEIARSPHFIFGIVRRLGIYCCYIDVLNAFFRDYKPNVIFFTPARGFISDLFFSLIKIYGVKHNNLAIWEEHASSFIFSLQR